MTAVNVTVTSSVEMLVAIILDRDPMISLLGDPEDGIVCLPLLATLTEGFNADLDYLEELEPECFEKHISDIELSVQKIRQALDEGMALVEKKRREYYGAEGEAEEQD